MASVKICNSSFSFSSSKKSHVKLIFTGTSRALAQKNVLIPLENFPIFFQRTYLEEIFETKVEDVKKFRTQKIEKYQPFLIPKQKTANFFVECMFKFDFNSEDWISFTNPRIFFNETAFNAAKQDEKECYVTATADGDVDKCIYFDEKEDCISANDFVGNHYSVDVYLSPHKPKTPEQSVVIPLFCLPGQLQANLLKSCFKFTSREMGAPKLTLSALKKCIRSKFASLFQRKKCGFSVICHLDLFCSLKSCEDGQKVLMWIEDPHLGNHHSHDENGIIEKSEELPYEESETNIREEGEKSDEFVL